MRLAWSASVLAVVVAACTDQPSPTAPSATSITTSPLALISDGAHSGGNPDFFFLPPLQPSPRRNRKFDAGRFDPKLSPVVKICDGRELTSAGECAHPLLKSGQPVVIKAVRGWDRLPDFVDPEQYHVLWQTRNYNLILGHPYRILVKVGSTLLGFLDLVPAKNLVGALRVTAGGSDIGWLDDLVVPIRFRIEQGALCSGDTSPEDCTQSAAVGAAPGTAGDTTVAVVLPSGHAALSIPPDAVRPGDTVTIVIEKQAAPYSDGTRCLPTDLVQSKGCYHFRTEPPLYQFATNVRMETCVDVTALTSEQRDRLQLYKYNTTQGLQALPKADPTLIDCTGFTTASAAPVSAPSNLAAALRRLGHLAERFLAPSPLHASLFAGVPKSMGGMGGTFSDVGGAVPPVTSLLPADVTSSLAFTVKTFRSGGGDSSYTQIGRLDPGASAWVSILADSAGWGVDPAPSLFPGGERLAFVKSSGGGSDIYTVSRDGTGLLRLTTDGWNGDPAVAPDGSMIAFAHNDGAGRSQIWLMGSDGVNARSIMDSGGSSPAWSPDGSRIAFSVSDYYSGGSDIELMTRDGGNRQRLTHSSGWASSNDQPAWSPTGDAIVYACAGAYPNAPGYFVGLCVMAPDGSNVRYLVHDSLLAVANPTWSPDGHWIAFSVNSSPGSGAVHPHIYLVHPDGSGLEQLITGSDSMGFFSPNWPLPFHSLTGVPARLVFTVQPSSTPVLTAMSPDVQVAIEDSAGNIVTWATDSVMLTYRDGNDTLHNPGWGQPAVNGVATFHLEFTAVGTGYTVSVTANGFAGATSNAFDVTCPTANDGVLCEPEWGTATTYSFNANLVGGGTTPAWLYVWNDAKDLHLAVRVDWSGYESSLAMVFDNDNDSLAENGDDLLVIDLSGFLDEFWTNTQPCTGHAPWLQPPAQCGVLDTQDGGASNGTGGLFRDISTVFEMSHPLNSGDAGHDFALASGQTVGMFLALRKVEWPTQSQAVYADTYYPGLQSYLRYTIK